jgi:hypothetical protein
MLSQEIVRSVVGTIGLIAAVPITTALAVFTARRTQHTKPAPKRRTEFPHQVRDRGWLDAPHDEWPAPSRGSSEGATG